jgi:conjugal transfer ATP-binding protein TraC
MLPLNFSPKLADQLAGEALMSASAACCLLPVYGDYLGNVGPRSQRTGAAFVTRRGSIHRFDPFSSNSHFSGVICAPPGAGKSVVLQELITCDLASGTKVILLDNGRSAKKFALGAGGKFYEFKFGGSGISASLNPFSGLDDDTFAEQQEGITSLVLLMAFYREEVDPGARIAAGEAVKAAWGQKRGDASLSTVLEALEQIERGGAERSTKSEPIIAATNLIPRLRAFIESPTRGPFFNGKGSIDISNQLCVFELGSLGDDHHLKKCVLYFLMNVLMTRLVGSNTPTLIYIDEAHDVMDDEGAASALNGLYQKGRKDKIGTWPVLQSIDKLTQSPAGRVIWNMSAWKLILQQTPEELGTVLKHELLSSFARDPYFERLLRSVETRKGDFSEVLILGERSYEAARLYLDPFTLMLFGSEGAARDDVFLLMERGMHPIAAVEQVLGDKKAKRRAWIREFLQQLRRADGMSALEVAREIREGMEDAA